MAKLKLFLLCLLFGNIFADVKIIIKYKATPYQRKLLMTKQLNDLELRSQMMKPLSVTLLNNLTNKIGYNIHELTSVANGSHVISIESDLSKSDLTNVIEKIKLDQNVEYVEQSQMFYMNGITFNPQQWDMKSTGDNFESLYNNPYYDNNKKPGESVVVAVIDTGYVPHSDYLDENGYFSLVEVPCGSVIAKNGYNNKCYGYQFISSCYYSNDKDCSLFGNINYHPDALDLGTYYCGRDLKGEPLNCRVSGSSLVANIYHGSHVSGSIIAQGHDNLSNPNILGGAIGSKVLPIRALGVGGSGSNYDIINAIYWAIGEYPGASNPEASKVKVINMSLGGQGNCSSTMQAAIDAAINKNVVVVVSAGNDYMDMKYVSPANCNGVISVSAKYSAGLSYYSNYGNTTITASGGSGAAMSDNIISTLWDNKSVFSYLSKYSTYGTLAGTSMAAPHVSAAVADLISYFLEKNLSYSNQDIISILQNSAQNLRQNCNRSGCVSTKALDASAALKYTMTVFNSKLTAYMNQESIKSLVVDSNNLQILRVVNLNSESIRIMSTYFNAGNIQDQLVIESNDCNKLLLNMNDACNIYFRLNGYSNFTNISLQMRDYESKIIMNLPIVVNNPKPKDVVTVGGCSIIMNGDDYSMILLLGILFILMLRKYLYSN